MRPNNEKIATSVIGRKYSQKDQQMQIPKRGNKLSVLRKRKKSSGLVQSARESKTGKGGRGQITKSTPDQSKGK